MDWSRYPDNCTCRTVEAIAIETRSTLAVEGSLRIETLSVWVAPPRLALINIYERETGNDRVREGKTERKKACATVVRRHQLDDII